MTKEEQIRFVLNTSDESTISCWLRRDVEVYLKDDSPYGLISKAYSEEDDVLYIMSATIDKYSKFTIRMFRDILSLHNSFISICVIFEDNDINTTEIASLFKKYGGTFRSIKNEVLWYNYKKEF